MNLPSTRLLTRARWVAGTLSRTAARVAAGATALAVAATVVAPATPAVAATRDDVRLSFTAAGFGFGESVDWRDYADAARRFGVDVGSHIDGVDIDRIVAAAWNASVERFATAGIGIGERPDATDFTDAAAWLGVSYGAALDATDAERILAAGRARVGRALHAAGIGYGSVLDAGDVREAGRRLGVATGERLDPQDTRGVVNAAWGKVASPLMATAAGVHLFSPSPQAVYHGWHQASGRTSLAMHAELGRKMPSRGRGTPGTSAVDVALEAGDPVRAPVTGRVVEVAPYALYGKYPDYRVRIVPDENPAALVTMIHMVSPQVRVGERVQGGVTHVAGGSRKFPFYSQVDGQGGRGRGHVHVELRPR